MFNSVFNQARSFLVGICLTASLFLLTSCSHNYVIPERGDALFSLVTAGEALRLINDRPELMVVDVRTGWERRGGWINGSVHISYFEFLFGGGYERLEKSRPVLLVCAHGARSYRVGRALIKKGWTEVYDLQGGMKAWTGAGYPVYTGGH